MKIDPRTVRKVRKTPTGYTAHLGSIYLGTFGSGTLASAAAAGAAAYQEHEAQVKAQKKLAREYRIQNPTPDPTPESLPKGIYWRNRRYQVGSPYYMGSFGTLEEAIAAQSNAPRKYKTKEKTSAIPFEERTLTLDD